MPTAARVCWLIAHEIEGHARQAINGERLFGVRGGALRRDDETLYEGLAMRNEFAFREKYFGKVNADIDELYYYVFAVHQAEKGKSFREIFDDQLERWLRAALTLPYGKSLPSAASIDPAILRKARSRAWRVTYRVMRGHADTSNRVPFAMPKDLSYLRGWLMDCELSRMGHAHLNEAAIVSVAGLEPLMEMELSPEDLPLPFTDIAPQYARMLLDERSSL